MNFKKYHVSRNLLPSPEAAIKSNNGITVRSDGAGRYYVSGTAENDAYITFNIPPFVIPISVSLNGNGTFSMFNTKTHQNAAVKLEFYYQGTLIDNWGLINLNRTSTNYSAMANKTIDTVGIFVKNGIAVDFQISPEFTNDGVLPANYEPYSSEVWHDIPHYIMGTSTDTITTLPAVLYPTGTTAIVGLKGQAVQSGTLTPDNPIIPQGTGERTGNLFDVSSVIYGIWTDNSGRTQPYGYGARSINISSNQITVSFNGSVFPYSYSIVWLDSNDEFIARIHIGAASKISEPQTFTPPSNAAKFYIQLANGTDAYYPITKEQIESYKPMLNSGSTAKPLEPYGYKIPISSAGQSTPVYLGEVESTRRIKKYVFTGEENGTIYSTGTSRKGIEITGITGIIGGNADIAILAICTHYQPNTRNALYRNTDNGISNAYQNDKIIFYDASCQTVEAFQQFCAQQYANGTPVTVWYILATEETGIVNEPLMKIGNYADEVSNISIPVTAGGDTLSVDTTVQPSEVTVNYKGWHPVADVHERNSGAWT